MARFKERDCIETKSAYEWKGSPHAFVMARNGVLRRIWHDLR